MQTRSTNTKGFVHYGGEVIAGVEDGIGIVLKPNSTAASSNAAHVEPVSDDDNVNIGIRAKGTGTVYIGNSSNGTWVKGALYVGGNVTPLLGSYSTTFAYAYAALTSGQLAEITLASTTCDVMPGDLISVSLGVPTVAGLAMINHRFSTAGTSRVTITVTNPTSTAFASTGSGTGRITWIDLT